MNQLIFSSQQSSYRAFREQLCDQVIGVDAPARAPSSFELNARLVQSGGSRIVSLENRGTAIEVARTCRRIATDGEECWAVGVCLEGSQRSSFRAGHEMVTRRSELIVTHSGTPHVGTTAPRARVGLLVIPDGTPATGWSVRHSAARDGLPRVLSAEQCGG